MKKILYISLISIASILTIYFFSAEKNKKETLDLKINNEHKSKHDEPPLVAPQSKKELETKNDLPTINTNKTPTILKNKMTYDEDWCFKFQLTDKSLNQTNEETASWKISRGYFEPEDKVSYQSYPDDILYQIGSNGDPIALDVLYERLSKTSSTISESEKILDTLVIMGSSRASIKKGHAASTRISKTLHSNALNEAELESYFLEAATHFRLSTFLGDYSGIYFSSELIKKAKIFHISDIDELLSIAADQSIEILDKIQNFRSEKGLPILDLSIPKSISNNNSRRINKLKIKLSLQNGTLWSEELINSSKCSETYKNYYTEGKI